MLVLKNPKIAVPVVLFAGLVWSFGPLVVRYMDNPQLNTLAIYFWKRSYNFYFIKFVFIF